jgi:peptidyl-prolyl cis-trans isomerase SurA
MDGRYQPGIFPLLAKTARNVARSWFVLRLAVLLMSTVGYAGEIVDRIVATVDHHAIVQSEWDDAVRFECLMNNRPLGSVTTQQRRDTLERVIDQTLLREQMEASSFPRASADEVAGRIRELRDKNASWKTDDGWHRALAQYGLTPDDISERVAMQVDMMHFIDLRFRPNIHIDPRSVEEYYVAQLLPELRRSGAAEITLKEASPKIEEVLVQQRMGEMLTAWLRNLRQQIPVVVR